MASIHTYNGTGKNASTTYRDILFVADGKRKKICLGSIPKRDAETIKAKVESIIAANSSGDSFERSTAEWIGRIDDTLHGKLSKIGLVSARPKSRRATLPAFLDGYIAGLTKIKPNTRVCLTQARNDLVEHFGSSKPLADITEGCAEEFRSFLRTRLARPGRRKSSQSRVSKASQRDRKPKQPPKQLQENTIRRRLGRARQLFQAAVRHRLIADNPFAELKGVSVEWHCRKRKSM